MCEHVALVIAIKFESGAPDRQILDAAGAGQAERAPWDVKVDNDETDRESSFSQ